MAYKFQLGSAVLSGSITQEGDITGSFDLSIATGGTIGCAADKDLMTLTDGVVTVAGEVSMTTLDIGGTNVTSTATELNLLDAITRGSILYGNASGATARLAKGSANTVLSSDGTDIAYSTVSNDMLAGSIGAGKLAGAIPDSKLQTIATAGKVALTALEIDGGTDINGALADADLIIIDDGAGGTNKYSAMSRVKTYVADLTLTTAAQTNITSVGNLAGGTIASGFGAIDNGTSGITSSGVLKQSADLAAAPSTSQAVAGQAGSITLGVGADAGIGVHNDHLYIENNTDTKDIIFRVHDGTDYDDIFSVGGMGLEVGDTTPFIFGASEDFALSWDGSGGAFVMKANVEDQPFVMDWQSDQGDDAADAWRWSINKTSGVMTLASKIDGDFDDVLVQHTPNNTLADSISAFGGSVTVGKDLTVTGNLTINGTTTTVDTTNMLVKDSLIGLNEGASSNANDCGFIIERGSTGNNAAFIWDESADKFTMGLTTDLPSATGDLTVTAGTLVVGTLEGDVTGDLTGTVQTAAQTNITSLGTLTALTVDQIAMDGKVMTMTGNTGDTAVFTVGTNGDLSIVTTDTAAAAANIAITADGTAELAGTTVTLNSGGGVTIDADNGTITFADGGVSLGTITSSGYSGAAASAATATVATTVTVSDNESTAENNAILFAAGAAGSGNVGVEADAGDLHYNPSTGLLTAPVFSGAVLASLNFVAVASLGNDFANAYALQAGKYNVVDGDLDANHYVKLPSGAAVGDLVHVKLEGAGGFKLFIESYADAVKIDGGDSIVLESDYAAVTLIQADTNDWRVF